MHSLYYEKVLGDQGLQLLDLGEKDQKLQGKLDLWYTN